MRSKPSLSTSDVKAMLDACEAEAAKNNLSMAISIVDEGGFLRGFIRMDGASVMAGETSLAKARTSGMSGMSTKFLEDIVAQKPGMGGGPMGVLPVQGGLPIMHDNQCIGGIGIGGAPSDVDERLCHVGLAALK